MDTITIVIKRVFSNNIISIRNGHGAMWYDQPLVLKLCRRLKTKASLSCLKLMNQTSQLGDIVASAEKSEDSTVLDQRTT